MNKLVEMQLTKRKFLSEKIFIGLYHEDINKMTQDRCTNCMMDYVFFTVEELHEMTRELPYMKDWKKNYGTLTDAAIKAEFGRAQKEFMDAIHFTLNITVLLNINVDKFDVPEYPLETGSVKDKCRAIKISSFCCTGLLHQVYEVYIAGVHNHHVVNRQPLYRLFSEIISFYMTIASSLGLSKEMVYKLFMDKDAINIKRQESGY